MGTGKKAGIYKITNKVDGRCYIGSSKDILKRIKDHFSALSKNKHINIKLQRAYDKHGGCNFEYDVVVLCSEEELLDTEQIYIDKFNSYKDGYNCSPTTRGVTVNVKTSIFLKNEHYVKGFIENLERINKLKTDLPELPYISFFGFRVNKTKQAAALFKRYYQATDMILRVISQVQSLDLGKEYRLSYITYWNQGEYDLIEDTCVNSREHNKVKSKQIVDRMVEDLFSSMGDHRYGKRVLSEYREYKDSQQE
jgi:group I intron endonuclease